MEERVLLAGVVNVIVTRGNVSIAGDGKANQIDVSLSPAGITVTGRDQTKIKFQNSVKAPNVPVAVGTTSAQTTLNLALANGNDTARVLFSDAVTLRQLNVNLGSGNDSLALGKIEQLTEVAGETTPTSITLVKPLTVEAGAGNDQVSFGFGGSGAVTLQNRFDVRLGAGNDRMELAASDFTVGSDASISAGVGNDSFVSRNQGHLRFQKNLIITMGGDADQLDMHSEASDSALEVRGILRIDEADHSNVSDHADRVSLSDNFMVDRDFTIHTRNGNDQVLVAFGDEAGGGASTIGGKFEVDTGIDRDKAEIITNGTLTIGGNFQVQTGIAEDELSILAGADLSIGRDFLVDTNANRDLVRILSVFGAIHVGHDLTVSAGADDDCLLIGLPPDFIDGGAPFVVDGIATITGDDKESVRGNDVIGVDGLTVRGNLNVRAGHGKNVLGLEGLAVGRDIAVDSGNQSDQISAKTLSIGGKTALRTGSGEDEVVTQSISFGGAVLVDLGSRDDKLEIGTATSTGVRAPAVTIDGGSGKDRFDSTSVLPAAAFKNFESDLSNRIDEVNGGQIAAKIAERLTHCFEEFSASSFRFTTCAFDSNLTGFTVSQSGGTDPGKGTVIGQDCMAILTEGNSFVVTLEKSFAIPATPSALQIQFETPVFDTTDPSFINDAFEIAIVDADGNTLVQPHTPGRDAVFNLTESLTPSFPTSDGIVVDGNTITIGLNGIPVGTETRAILRLVNNDSDTTTSVRVTDLKLINSALQAALPDGASSAARQSFVASTSEVVSLNKTSTSFLPTSSTGSNDEDDSGSGSGTGGGATSTLLSDPNDSRTWQGASVGTFAQLIYGSNTLANRQRVIDEQLLDAGRFVTENTYPAQLLPTSWTSSTSGAVGRSLDSTGTGSYGYVTGGTNLFTAANSIDNLWFQSSGRIGDTVFDLGVPSTKVAIFNTIDHGPLPGEAIESSVYLSNDRIQWTPAVFQRVWLEGWHEISGVLWDGFAFAVGTEGGEEFQYVSVIHGGPGALRSDGDDEINGVLGLGDDFLPSQTKISITASVPATTVEPGTTILISGQATSRTENDAPAEITLVTVNGVPVETFDVRGSFFSRVEVQPGRNEFVIRATDEFDQSAATTLVIEGTSRSPGTIDFSQFSDITGSFSGAYFRTSFNEGAKLLNVELATKNDGPFVADVPLLVGVTNISDPSVSVVGADGLTPDGIPFYDYSQRVPGSRLEPGELTESPTVTFHNPNRVQFTYDLVFYGKLNEAPVITTLPDIEALAGRPYRYDVDATDPDQDTLTYALTVAPTGMTINNATGLISWTPTPSQLGLHDVSLQVTDGRGGTAEQHYTVSVIPAPPNRPPVITSIPITSAEASEFIIGDEELVDLAQWTPIQLNPTSPLNWIVTENGTRVKQVTNNGPGIFLSDFDLTNDKVEGVIRVDPEGQPAEVPGDDDFIGFVFGVQQADATPAQFYLFDWKRRTQSIPGAFGEVGMTVKVVNHTLPLSEPDVWNTAGQGDSIRTLFHNNIPWQYTTDYRFTLEFQPGEFTITVRNGDTILDTIHLFDDTYLDGGFGFYNTSQEHVIYRAFTREIISAPTYDYDVEAIDPDDDVLTYQLVTQPDGMRIGASTGRIFWTPAAEQIGNHTVKVRVEDGHGGLAEQEFVVCVKGDPANHAPVIVSEPVATFSAVERSNPPQGMTAPSELFFMNTAGEMINQTVSLTLSDGGEELGTADIIFIVDESGSMAGEQAWLGDIITTLDASLRTAGLTNNRYGLVGFTNSARILQSGGDRWMNATNFATASNSLSTNRGGSEDGYLGINYALNNYTFRDNASRSVILVTDEERTTVSAALTFSSIANRLTTNDIVFSIVANARMEDGNATPAYGVAGDGTAYVSDGSMGFLKTPGGAYVSSEPNGGDIANIEAEYVDLAWSIGGITWDLNFLRQDDSATATFTSIFVDILGESIIRNIPINVVASSADIGFVNLSGIQSNIAPGQTVSFDVQFVVPSAARFDIAFINATTNQVIASIPVAVNDAYQYQVAAIDPDSDELQFALTSPHPAEMSIDSTTGLLTWNVPGDFTGTQQVTVQVTDGRGGFDAQTVSIVVASTGTGEIHGSKFLDLNRNGIREIEPAQETGLADWAIYLDQNENGVRDVGERFTLTDADGNYAFTALPAGTYVVREELQPGWQQTKPGNGGVPTVRGDGYADVVLDYFASGSAGRAEPFGRTAGVGFNGPVTTDVVLGPPPPSPIVGGNLAVDWLSLPIGSYITVGFNDETIIDGPGNDIFIRSLDPADSAGESADVYVSSNLIDFVRLGTAPQGGNVGLDLATIGFTQPVRAVRIVGLDQRGASPGFDLVAVQVLPNSIGPGDGSYVVPLTAGQIVNGIDFGNQQVAGSTNEPPAFTSVPIPNGIVSQTYRYDARANDPENDSVNFDLAVAPVGMTVHPTLGTVVWIPTKDQLGSHQLVLRVRDDRGGTALQPFTITVVEPNAAPSIISSPPEDAAVGVPTAYQVAAQDADGDVLAFRLEAPLAGMSIDEDSGLFSWTPTAAQAGSRNVTVVVTDGRGGEGRQTFSVTVAATGGNVAPSFDSMPRTRAFAGFAYAYALSASDPNGGTLTFTLDDGPTGMTLDDQNVLRWTPTFEQAATASHPVRVRVSDGQGGSVTQEFAITVGTEVINDPPRITSNPPLVAIDGREYVYNLRVVDADADPLTWRLDIAPAGMSLDPLLGTVRWMPREDQFGEQTVVVSVQDIAGQTDTQRFVIDVRCANTAPAIVSIPPTTAVAARTYLYAVRAEDLERGALQFDLPTKPTGMTIDEQTGVIRWSPTAAQIGLHDVVITATDAFGAIGRQMFTVKVSNAADPLNPDDLTSPPIGNRAPIITSTPNFNAEVDTAYEYAVTAIDPDGDALTYSVTPLLSGMTINATTGLIQWTPTAAHAGQHTLTVTVRDANNAIATQGFILLVTVNQPPEIRSQPITTVTAGTTYRYTVRAADPDNDPLTYRLTNPPDGMTIDPLGRILWNTTATDAAREIPITVTVTDDHGEAATQTFTLTVTADQTAPAVRVVVVRNGVFIENSASVDIGSTVTFQVTATDNVGVATMFLSVNGELLPLDAAGRADFVTSAVGPLDVQASARDAAGNMGEATIDVQVVNPAVANQPQPTDPTLPTHPGRFDPTDTRPPFVEITSPAINATVTNLVPIIGTVDDPENNLWYFRVYAARLDLVSLDTLDTRDPDWKVLNTSTQEVINGELAKFDPSNLTNDPYAIIVAAFDINGRGYIQPTVIVVEGNVQLGNFHLEFTDLSLPLAGIPMSVTRVYDTLNAGLEGDFGFGWSLGVQDARILETVPSNTQFIAGKTKVYLTNPEGRRVGFTYQEELVSASFFGAIFRPVFKADPGVYDSLTIDQTQIGRGGIVGAFQSLNGPFNPNVYTLTTKDGLKYRYDQSAGLQTITDLNNNVVTFTESGIRHSSGASIDFIRDFRGRINEIRVPSESGGQPLTLTYQYDAKGDLRSFTNQASLTTRYDYLATPAHFLDKAFDPLNRKVLEVRYEDGRYVGVFDAAGNLIDQRDYDTDANTAIIRDANGNPTTLLYDDRGNVIEETDPLGQKTIRRYEDPRNPDLETTIIDRNGNVTNREYDTRGNLLTIIERGSTGEPLNPPVVTQFTYDMGNRVKTITNARNATTTFVYDAKGNLTKITNAEGNSSSFTYDNEGRRQTFTDFNGNTTTFNYDNACPCGSPHQVIFADGTYQIFEYNQYGQVTLEEFHEANGTLVEIRETKYDASGRVTEEKSGSGNDPAHPPTIVRKFYSGHLLDYEIIVNPASPNETPATPVAQRQSRITDYDYDANDRLIRQTDAEGGVVEFRYDAQGNRISLMDPVGNITTWLYDGLNRVIEERDPLYWDDLKTRDAVFASLSDHDFLNRIAPTLPGSLADPLYDDPSGADATSNRGAAHVRVTAYDGEGNQSKTIDRNGRRREFEYDHAGRLEEERWYNEPTHATAPDALVETLTFNYDTLGNMLTASDSNSNYLFTYDTLNRLHSVDNNPDGTRDVPRVILTYGYDKQGNVTLTKDDAGVTVASTYNARNLLETRKWFDADHSGDVDDARVDFRYNAAGRESEIRRYSDLTATTLVGRTVRTYDTSGRSNLLTHLNATNSLIAGYDYDYDFAGLLTHEVRTHQDAQYAQTIDYTYDLTSQLTNANFTGQADEHYVYDANGNRKFSRVGTEERNYMTAPANQLESDGHFRYEYDGEGNMVKKTALDVNGQPNGNVTTFEYDHGNRLVRVTEKSHGGVNLNESLYTYDVNGRRIAQRVNGQPLFTAYNGDNAWSDYGPANAVKARYLFGNSIDENHARFRPGEGTSWYRTDHLGTVRDIMNATGVAINHVDYGSFGDVLRQTNAGVSDRFLFTGRELDTLVGEYYFRARHVSPGLGRFTSLDPLGFLSEESNLYRYLLNSPTSGVDPSGNVSLLEAAVFVGAVYVIGCTAAGAADYEPAKQYCPDVLVEGVGLFADPVPPGLETSAYLAQVINRLLKQVVDALKGVNG